MTEQELDIVVPDVADTLLGFRVWQWEPDSLTLWSVNAQPQKQKKTRQQQELEELLSTPEGVWTTTLDAECDRRDVDTEHEPPEEHCGCGIYATYKLKVIAGYLRTGPVLGLVQGWGKCINGEGEIYAGFRAQHARIACLFSIEEDLMALSATPGINPPVSHYSLKKLAERYEVPVIRPHSINADDYRKGVRTNFAPGWDAKPDDMEDELRKMLEEGNS